MKSKKLLLNVFLIFAIMMPMFLVSASTGHAQTSQDWTEPINLSNSGSAYDPILIVDKNGTFHVIWFDLFDGYKYVKSDDGVVWTKPINVKFPFSPPKTSESIFSIENIVQPRFIVDSNNIIHIFWLDKKNNLYHSKILTSQLDNPAAWSVTIKLSDSVLDFDTKIDTFGDVNLAFLKNISTDLNPAGIYYRKFKGANWSEITKLYTSQYFRSLQPENAHVRIAVSSDFISSNVYVVWDDLAQKNILMISSATSGENWVDPHVVVNTDEKSGFETPHDVEISIMNNNILLMWQTGQGTQRCVQNSRLSEDGGITWGEKLRLFGDFGGCPVNAGLYDLSDAYLLGLFNIQDDLALVAWNGNQWSDIQIQSQLSTIKNPVTQDQILLGCQQIFQHDGILYVVGCDEGTSKDIWFTSRVIGSASNWFPPPSAWSVPVSITSVQSKILSASSVADSQNDIHLVWNQSAIAGTGDANPTIYYSRWNEKGWLRPVPIIVSVTGSPTQLSLADNGDGRLVLVWVDQTNGGVMFSWSNSSRANIPLEWSKPAIIPIPYKLISSPSVLTYPDGNIVLTYAVPYNENRGIYVIRSSDFGGTWSQHFQVINASASGWDFVDRPKLTLSLDGTLSVVFLQYSLLNIIQPVGLYYSQSRDGGETWKDPMRISDQMISWSEIFSFDNQVIHLLWQEYRNEDVKIFHQYSMDGGNAWSKPETISSSTDEMELSAATIGVDGNVHFMQLAENDPFEVRQWLWDGSRWIAQESVNLSEYSHFAVPNIFMANITSDGSLSVISSLENKDKSEVTTYELVGNYRHVDLDSTKQLKTVAALPTLNSAPNGLNIPSMEETPAVIVLTDKFSESPSSNGKNLLGIVLVVVVLVVMFITIRPSPKSK